MFSVKMDKLNRKKHINAENETTRRKIRTNMPKRSANKMNPKKRTTTNKEKKLK